jgi:hypothetical protein
MFLVMVQRMTAAFGSKSRTASFDRPTVWTVLWGLDEATRSKTQDFHLLGKSSQQKGVKIRFLPQHLAWKTPNILQCYRPQLP